jgi:hypothetical protein
MNIPPIFGRELSHNKNYDGKNIISFVIFPCEDLFIKTSLEFEISFPENYETATEEIIIITKQPDIFTECEFFSPFNNSFSIPFLVQKAGKYPISVWFYSLRQILKRSNRSLWRTPVMIKSKFLENREINAGLIATDYDEIKGRTLSENGHLMLILLILLECI